MSQQETVPTPTPATIAKLRRSGAKWDEVREKTGQAWTDTKFRKVLRAAGYAPSGIKGGEGIAVATRKAAK
jgi:hypothetical protein